MIPVFSVVSHNVSFLSFSSFFFSLPPTLFYLFQFIPLWCVQLVCLSVSDSLSPSSLSLSLSLSLSPRITLSSLSLPIHTAAVCAVGLSFCLSLRVSLLSLSSLPSLPLCLYLYTWHIDSQAKHIYCMNVEVSLPKNIIMRARLVRPWLFFSTQFNLFNDEPIKS